MYLFKNYLYLVGLTQEARRGIPEGVRVQYLKPQVYLEALQHPTKHFTDLHLGK